MKHKKTKLALAALVAGTLAYFGPTRVWNETKHLAENLYYETKGLLSDTSININLSTDSEDISDKFVGTTNEKDLYYKLNLPGKDLKYFKVTLDDRLVARGVMKNREDGRVLMIQDKDKIKYKKFPRFLTELSIAYAAKLKFKPKKGLHKLKLWVKDTKGNEYVDKAMLRIYR